MLPREQGSSPHNFHAENCRMQAAAEIIPIAGESCSACSRLIHEESVERARAFGTLRELGS